MVEEADLDDVKGVFCSILLIGWAVYRTVLEGVDEWLELFLGLGSQKDERFFGGKDDDHFTVDWVKVFVVEDGLSGKSQEKPVEKVVGVGVLGSIQSCDENKGVLVFLFDDSLEFFPPEEEVFRGVLDLV